MPSRADYRCPRCGTPVEPLQEYCLQCGIRLPNASRAATMLVAAWRRVLPWYPGDWIWPVLALAFLTVGSTAVALGAKSARNAAKPILVATSSHVTVSIGSTTTPTTTAPPTVPTSTTVPTVPQPTISTGTLPIAPGSPSTSTPTTTATTTASTTTTSTSGVRSWPSGTSAWTNVLESLPESAGRAAAVARARDAQRAGIPNVGVLLSSGYSSLHAGYWVVFAGVYATQAEAESGLATARSRGFAGAYPAHVAP